MNALPLPTSAQLDRHRHALPRAAAAGLAPMVAAEPAVAPGHADEGAT